MSNRSMLVAFSLAVATLAGCRLSVITGSGDIESRAVEVADFAALSLGTPGRVLLSQGSPAELVIVADDNILEFLDVVQESDHVQIGVRPWVDLWATREIEYRVQMPEVEALAVSGSGNIDGLTPIASPALDLAISGSGGMDLELAVGALQSAISGSGGLSLAGEAVTHDIQISNSGAVDAFDLETQTTTVAISGSGGANVFAVEELDVTLSGSGGVVYEGNPTLHTQISGSGGVDER